MLDPLHPSLLFLAAAALIPLLPSMARSVLSVLAPLAALILVLGMGKITAAPVVLYGFDLVPLRLDALSQSFALLFCAAAIVVSVFAFSVTDRMQQVATLIYAGSAVGAVLAGDLITLFIWWEGTALASVFLIAANRTEKAYATAMRYLFWQIGSGTLLFAGIAVTYQATGTIAFDTLWAGGPETWPIGTWMILVAMGVKCAFPLLHVWLPDAYPNATVTGAVILSAFTTKLALYGLARGFAGAELLIIAGAVMALYPIFHAMAADDLRRVLSYSLMSQLGFMVAGVGVGTELAINGSVAHATASVFYKGLLFMAVGAVMLRTGSARASDLGGLARAMPVTLMFCLIGSASIAAVPLFSGFVAKPLVLSALSKEWTFAYYALMIASAAAVIHTAIRIPFLAFFGSGETRSVEDAPLSMKAGMALAALACLGIGFAPGFFYAYLPHSEGYHPYSASHIVTQLQLLAAAGAVFALALWRGWITTRDGGIVLDADWFYRKAGPAIVGFSVNAGVVFLEEAKRGVAFVAGGAGTFLAQVFGPTGRIARVQTTGRMVLWIALLLIATLLVSLLDIS